VIPAPTALSSAIPSIHKPRLSILFLGYYLTRDSEIPLRLDVYTIYSNHEAAFSYDAPFFNETQFFVKSTAANI
jgi:hypothetical protein